MSVPMIDEKIYDLYVARQCDVQSIAESLSVTQCTIYRHIQRCGIKLRPSARLTVHAERINVDAFWSQVDKNGPLHPYKSRLGRCWIWTGSNKGGRRKDGYGLVSQGRGEYQLAHHVAYELRHNCKVPSDKILRHTCDNRPCVRHTVVGTHRDNVCDAIERNRFVPPPHPNSAQHPEAIIIDPKAVMNMLGVKTGWFWRTDRRVVAKHFGVSLQVVKQIINGSHWSVRCEK